MTPGSKAEPPADVTTAHAGARASLLLRLVAVAIAAVFVLPGGYVVWRSMQLGTDVGEVLGDTAGPLWRTVQLAVLVSLSGGVIGTALAWLLVRTDVPGRRVWRVLVVLPLVFPSFVGAAAFLAGLAPNGLLRGLLNSVGIEPPRRFRGMGAAWLVLTLFTYPYVYLTVAARLTALPTSMIESARLLGDSPRRLFVRVVLPMLRSSILGGMLLIFLYLLSEFGAVQLLGFDTLTRVIYATRLIDRAQSFGASGVLLVLALAVVVIERRMRGSTTTATAKMSRPASPLPLGRWRIPAFVGVAALVTVALVVPVASLAQWAWRGLIAGDGVATELGHDLGRLVSPMATSAWLSVAAAILGVVLVLPAAVLSARYGGRLSRTVSAAVVCGFAVPGLVVALSLVFWSLNTPVVDGLYQTAPLLLGAYVVHFGSQAMRASETAVAAVPDRVRESARLLGAGPIRRAVTVHAPLMAPGLLAGGGLVLLAVVKELPATLLLAPTGLETLATRVWGAFEEGFLAEAGLASIVLVLVSAVLTWVLVVRRADHL